jgi:hypothetical protein
MALLKEPATVLCKAGAEKIAEWRSSNTYPTFVLDGLTEVLHNKLKQKLRQTQILLYIAMLIKFKKVRWPSLPFSQHTQQPIHCSSLPFSQHTQQPIHCLLIKLKTARFLGGKDWCGSRMQDRTARLLWLEAKHVL